MISRQLKHTVAASFSIIWDKVATYNEFVGQFKKKDIRMMRYKGKLGYNWIGKYSPGKSNKEKYVIQIATRVKYLKPTMSESDMINKLAQYFKRGIQVAMSEVLISINISFSLKINMV